MKFRPVKKDPNHKCPLYQAAIIGNPNSGKTTLFNRLTGSQQTTGNWPGVTVEQKFGAFQLTDHHFNVIDLPGLYSMENDSHSGLDEQVARDYLFTQKPDLVLNVVDATSLERQLFLTAQLLHMGLPVVVVLNRMDLLKERNLQIDTAQLSQELGCPVIPVSSYFNQGLDELKEALPSYLGQDTTLHFELPESLHESVHKLRDLSDTRSENCWNSLQKLMKPSKVTNDAISTFARLEKQKLEALYEEDLTLIVADLYFQFAHDASHKSATQTDKFTRNTTDSIDQWALHKYWGLPIFMGVMYLLFALSITVGNAFIDFFDLTAQALFVDGQAHLLFAAGSPDWLTHFLAYGVGGGLQVVATFIPIIAALFLFLSLLEESGYMQRAALLMDRYLRKLGLSGQAFVPLVVGFGCNVPSVLASRTLPDQKDRIMTIMMTPFMSCSARLTVYVLFATAFFADYAALFVFSLYLLGILAAVGTALLLKHTLLPGEAPPLLMELPIYNKPAVANVLLNTRNKLKGFLLDAGKIIVIVVVILNVFNSLGTDGSFGNQDQSNSVLSTVAKAATPAVEPLGITEENWPATVGIITGLLAKEVVVGSLDALYQNMDGPSTVESDHYDFFGRLKEAAMTIPENITGIVTDLDDPLGLASISSVEDTEAIAEDQGFSVSTLDTMANYFDGKIGAYAYLILILLYFPCVATFAAIKQEIGWRWALYSSGWSIFLGYTLAVLFYQTMTYATNPSYALSWILGILFAYTVLYLVLKREGRRSQVRMPE